MTALIIMFDNMTLTRLNLNKQIAQGILTETSEKKFDTFIYVLDGENGMSSNNALSILREECIE